MCGITGIWGQADNDLVEEMTERMAHRGPDARGTFASGAGALGHCRLSIMDPQGGDHPIYSDDRSKAIIGNGEIYNYPELRRALAPQVEFHTGCDTESALHLFETVGTDAASRLDGMFALAIADGNDLYLARDPIGIKPLYYSLADGRVVFASELKALVGLVDEVSAFPPGSWYHTRYGLRSYYTVPRHQPVDAPPEEHARALRTTLERAVVKRLMSDVPVGAFLSGGLDSSIIAALARPHLDELHTFSVGFEGSPDLAAARRVSRVLDTVHHEYVISTDELLDKLPEIVYHLESYDLDLVRSAIPCYFTARLAAEHVKVILTGEGADELFAGYRYYRDIEDGRRLHDELRRSVLTLHDVNLQRVDRLTMAHSVEGRVPFLDAEMIELAQRIPPEQKLHRQNGDVIEKWILRTACEGLLPAEIVWRDKAQFDEGSGTVAALGWTVGRAMTTGESFEYATGYRDANLRSPEECFYHKLLREAYGDAEVIFNNVARWAMRPTATSSGSQSSYPSSR